MFVDASVIVAILNQEPGWEELVKQLSMDTSERLVSPLVRFEAIMSLARAVSGGSGRKPTPAMILQAGLVVDDFINEIDAREIPISDEIGIAAVDAAARYGKAVGHPADLNFGDCFAYACARVQKTKLAYKGNDFAQTDLA
ncbi:ribonuclease [Aminobacter sp. DSM 101952]|uniref:type II toxin-antitoxin system VapC family toxin n=1 Tax=Aminobacter sp. DSM 101952 TaxID=2735891 RepID=UPI0006F794A8|nr:type II toxin-antitoxin system VapC family toxin [Aminobacter sp. DSM 101952]KQU65652.1 ribonuclease [Aminobacter sp. DSM 101952]